MKATIRNLFNSINQLLNLVNRTINSADAVMEAAEAHAEAFRDNELADLKANESDNLKQYRAAKLTAPKASTS